MADQTSPHEPGHQAFVADSAEGEFTVKTSSQSASHLRASASVSSLATFSSPEQRDCLVPSASKTSVCPVANCAPSTAAPGSHSLSSNRRSSLTSFQQGNPELAFIPQLGASAKSDTSELRPHTGFKTSLPTPHQPCASEYANPGSRNISPGMAPLRTRTPLALVPVSCDLRTGAPCQDTRNMTEGTLPTKNADKGNKQFKTIVEKTDGSFGGRGEMVGLHVFTVSPKYEAGFLGNTNRLNYETEEESTVSEDNGEWGWGSVNRSRYSQTPKQPDMRNISNVLDDLIDVFEPQSSSKGSSASLSKRRISPSRRRLTRSESEKKREMSIINNVFDDLLGVFDPQRDPKSSSVSLSPKRTRSLPLPAGEKRYRVTPPNTKRRKTAVRRRASTLRRRPLSTVKASDKESSSDKTSQEQGDIERVLTACSVLESVNTYVSNEVPQFSQSQLNRNPRQKKGKRKNKKGRRKSGQKSKRSSDDKSKKRRRKLSDVSIDKPRSLSKQKRRRNGGEKSGKGSPVLGREGTETSEDTPQQSEDASIDKPQSLSKQKRRRNGGEKSGKGSPVLGREGTETSEDTPKQSEHASIDTPQSLSKQKRRRNSGEKSGKGSRVLEREGTETSEDTPQQSEDASLDKPPSLSKQKRRRNSGDKSVKGSPVLGREGTETSEDTPKQPEGNKSGDGQTLPPSQHGTPRWRKWGTQLLGTLQSSCSPSCPKGSDKVAKPPPKELPSRDRNSVPPRQAPGKVVSHVQNGPANQETANLRKTEHPLETDDYRDTNGNGKTPRKTDSLSSVSSSEVRPDDLSTESPGKLRRVEAKRDVGMKSSSATSKVVDVAVDMEVPVSDDRKPKRKTKKRFHEEFPRIYIQDGRRQPANISESEESFVEQDQKGKTITLSEQPSSTYENTLEEDTEIPAANVLRRQRRRRSKTGKTVRNDEPLSEPSYFYENTLDDDTDIPAANVLQQQKRRSSKTGKTARNDKLLSMPGGRPRHIGPAENRPGGNRERFMPKSEKSRYDKDVSIRNFEAMGAVESESSFENRPHSLTTTLPLNSPARTNTGGSTPYPRNSSRSFSIGSEWRPCESSNYSGAFNVRFRKRRPARPGSPAQRIRKRSFQQRYLGPPLLRPHRTTPLPLTGAQPAPVGYGHEFETNVYAPLLRHPYPVQSPLSQGTIRPPVCFEPTTLYNNPTIVYCNSLRRSLAHGTRSHLQGGLCTSKSTDVMAAEPNFPQPVEPQPEQEHTNKQSVVPPSPFQATFDAAKYKQSLSRVNFPQFAATPPSALPTVPTLSPNPAIVEEPDTAIIRKSSTHFSSRGPERFQANLFHRTESHTQENRIPVSADSCEGSCSNSSKCPTSTKQPSFENEREMERQASDAGSMDLVIQSTERRFHSGDIKTMFGGRVSVALFIMLACFTAVIAAGFAIRVLRPQPWEIPENDDSGEHPWLYSPLSHNDTATRANFSSCESHLCNEHVTELVRSVDANVRPCVNFYWHVCALVAANGTADEQLAQLTLLRVLSILNSSNSDGGGKLPLVGAASHLWHHCVRLDTLSQKDKAPLLALLNLTGLSAWPYDGNVSLPDVWKVAGHLQRLMALAPLVELKGLANGKARLALGKLGGSDDAGDVLDAMLAFRSNRSRLRELAADVAGLNRHLKMFSYRRPTPRILDRSDLKIFVRSYLEAALVVFGSDVGAVAVQCEPLVRLLVQFVRGSKPETVLNMLGYRLVRHVRLFTPAAATVNMQPGAVLSREASCTRAILDDALSHDEAEYVRYAALRDHLNVSSVRSVVRRVKRALNAKLADQHWLDVRSRTSVQHHLKEVKVRFFFERYERSSQRKLASRTLAPPSDALATYQRFRESRFRTRLLQDDRYDEGSDHDCAYDERKKVLFLRLSTVELREPQSPLWPARQAARLGPRLSRCILRVLLPLSADRNIHAAVQWSPAAQARLGSLRACVSVQHAQQSKATESPWNQEQEALAVVDNAALGPARDVFRAYVEHLVTNDPGAPSTNDAARRSIESDQAFYLLYAHSMCESPDQGQLLPPHTPPWETVNYQLSNDEAFQRAFECRVGDAMRLDKTCSFWDPRL